MSSADITVVSDGKGNFACVRESGDEPLIIAKAVQKAVVMSGPNRYRTGLEALERFGCNVFVLDDGFQHYSLARDFDLVLIDYNDEPRKDSLLPSGRLREPLAALSRASQVVITKVPDPFEQQHMDDLALLVGTLTPKADIAACRFPAKRLPGFVDGRMQSFPLSFLNGLKVVTFCGLARPEHFLAEVQASGASVMASRTFPDHHWYTPQDLDSLQAELTRTAAAFLITTEKDLVKLQNSLPKANILAIEQETEWLTGFPKKLEKFTDKLVVNQTSLRLSEMGVS